MMGVLVWFRRRRRVEMDMVMERRGWGRDGEWATGGGVGMVNGQQGVG
jgi:hypothetical protein